MLFVCLRVVYTASDTCVCKHTPCSTQLNNVNASTRALTWSTALDGRRPINNQARWGRNTILRHCPQPRAPFATCKCMRPTQLGLGLQSWETFRKKLTHCSMILRKRKNMAVPAPTATLSETKKHSSIPHQNKLKDQKDTTVFPLLTLFHSQSSRCSFPTMQM